jgi:GT2 family glycosyltransferase
LAFPPAHYRNNPIEITTSGERNRNKRNRNKETEKWMEPMLDLTVIIPSYNTRRLLHDCISSIYEHTHGITFEVICIDDNSDDGSADMVAAAFLDVVLVRNQTNQGYVRNTNLGMSMSRARYACHLNSDTLLISNAFRPLVRYMDENPQVAACGPKLLNPDRTVQHCIRHFSGPGTMLLQALNWHKLFPRSRLTDRYYATGFDYSKAQPVDSIGTTAYVVRRSTWENAGMLDERFRLFVSDLAYNFMLKQKGYPVHYTPCAEIVHFGSQSVNQNPLTSLGELHDALIAFNDAYDYFGKSRASKLLVGLAVKVRACWKRAEYYLSSDKRVIKGPGAPPKARASAS